MASMSEQMQSKESSSDLQFEDLIKLTEYESDDLEESPNTPKTPISPITPESVIPLHIKK
jgi:hypothetical protein